MKATPLYRRASLLGGQAALEPVSGGRVQIGKSMSKSIQKTMQNQWKIEVRGPQIEVRRGPGGVWDGSWAVLSVWIAFLVFVVGRGCVLWAKRRQLGPNLGPKMEP